MKSPLPSKSSNRRKVIILAVTLGLLGCGSAAYFIWGRTSAASPMADRDLPPGAPPTTLPGGGRGPHGPGDWEKLTPEQRQARADQREAEADKRLDDYFALPPGPQRTAKLDEVIKEMEQRRAEFEKRMAANPPSTNPNAAGGPAGGGPGGPGRARGGPRDPARMLMRMSQTTHPERAARRAQFMSDMMQRRKELGLLAMPFGPGRPR